MKPSFAVLLLLLAAPVGAQTPAPLGPLPIKQTFATDTAGWSATGMGAKLAIAGDDAAKIGSPSGALRLDYTIGKGNIGLAILPIAPGGLARANSLRLTVKADANTPVAVALQEKDGGRYVAFFTAPKDKWQIVELTPADFNLSVGKDDPKDPDNKLDMETVEAVAVTDIAQLLAQGDSASFNDVIGLKTGPHTLYLADVTFATIPLPRPAADPDGRLDKFDHPQTAWMTVGNVSPSITREAPLAGRGMKVIYQQAPGKVAVLVRAVPPGRLVGTTKVSLSLAASRPTTLIVQVEDKRGGKYNANLYLPSGVTTLTETSLAFSDFKEAEDSATKGAALNLADVTQFTLIDITGVSGEATPGENTLYVSKVAVR